MPHLEQSALHLNQLPMRLRHELMDAIEIGGRELLADGVALANATCAKATVVPTQIANSAYPASNATVSRQSLAAPATETSIGTTASRPGDLLFGLLHAPISRLISHCLYGVSISLHVSVLSKAAAAYTSFWARRGG